MHDGDLTLGWLQLIKIKIASSVDVIYWNQLELNVGDLALDWLQLIMIWFRVALSIDAGLGLVMEHIRVCGRAPS